MREKDFQLRVIETISAGDIHHQRMNFALEKMQHLLPITLQGFSDLTPEEISFTDQLIYRFSKLQDLIGRKLFRLILIGLGEEVENVPFIDLLHKLEKLRLIKSKEQWFTLRELRNQISHEYPHNTEELVNGLNELYMQSQVLSGIWQSFKKYAENRFL